MHIRYKPRVTLGNFAPSDMSTATAVVSPTSTGGFVGPTQTISPQPTLLIAPQPSYMEPPKSDLYIPEQFRYSKEQLADMLARGASETYERTGEDDSGLPNAYELEQLSRENDATKQYAIDADGVIVAEKLPTNAVPLIALIAAFLLFGA